MDQETREMFEKVLGMLEILKTDVSALKTDMNVMKLDMDILRLDMHGMNQGMNIMYSSQNEMNIMLNESEERRQRMKSMDEKGSVSALERDNLRLESAKIVGALLRGAHEILNGIANEEVRNY